MATTVDTLLVRIESDMKEFRKDLKKIETQTQKSTKKVEGSFKTMALGIKGVVAGVIGVMVLNLGRKMVALSSQIEESTSKARVVFGNNFNAVNKELSDFGDTVGRSTHELVAMASTVQDTFVPMGFARDEASKLSVQLSKLAVDVASFNNASDVDTMRAFQSAIVGNHETVRRFGVVITEATLKQELLRMGINKSAKDVTNAEKVQARLNLIIDGTSDAHGDAIETAGSFENSNKALTASLEELGDSLTRIFLPALSKVVQGITAGTVALKDFLMQVGIIQKTLIDIDPFTKLAERFLKFNKQIEQLEKLNPNFANKLNSRIMSGGALTSIFDSDEFKKYRTLRIEVSRLIGQLKLFRELDNQILQKRGKLTASTAKTFSSFDDLRGQRFGLGSQGRGFGEGPEKKQNFQHLFSSSVASEDIISLAKQQAQILKTQAEETARLNKLRFDQNIIMNKNIEAHIRSNSVSDMEFQALQEEAMAELEFSKQRQEELKKELAIREQLTDVAIRGFDKMESAMLDFADGTTKGFDGIKDAMRFFIRDLQRTILKMTVFNAIKNAMFGLTGANALPTADMGQIGSNIMGMFGKAGGGAMQRGKPYLVGERGAELFVPNTGGTLMNSMNTRNMGGGSTIVNQTINVETGVAPTVRAEIMNLLPSIKRDTISSLIEAKKRGGNIATAFA